MKYVFSKEYVIMKLKELREKTKESIDVENTKLDYLVGLCNQYNLSMDFFVIVE